MIASLAAYCLLALSVAQIGDCLPRQTSLTIELDRSTGAFHTASTALEPLPAKTRFAAPLQTSVAEFALIERRQSGYYPWYWFNHPLVNPTSRLEGEVTRNQYSNVPSTLENGTMTSIQVRLTGGENQEQTGVTPSPVTSTPFHGHITEMPTTLNRNGDGSLKPVPLKSQKQRAASGKARSQRHHGTITVPQPSPVNHAATKVAAKDGVATTSVISQDAQPPEDSTAALSPSALSPASRKSTIIDSHSMSDAMGHGHVLPCHRNSGRSCGLPKYPPQDNVGIENRKVTPALVKPLEMSQDEFDRLLACYKVSRTHPWDIPRSKRDTKLSTSMPAAEEKAATSTLVQPTARAQDKSIELAEYNEDAPNRIHPWNVDWNPFPGGEVSQTFTIWSTESAMHPTSHTVSHHPSGHGHSRGGHQSTSQSTASNSKKLSWAHGKKSWVTRTTREKSADAAPPSIESTRSSSATSLTQAPLLAPPLERRLHTDGTRLNGTDITSFLFDHKISYSTDDRAPTVFAAASVRAHADALGTASAAIAAAVGRHSSQGSPVTAPPTLTQTPVANPII